MFFDFFAGLNDDGLNLLQQYVDVTSDVQTAAAIVVQALANQDLARETRVTNWIESYRSLLDVWCLWTER